MLRTPSRSRNLGVVTAATLALASTGLVAPVSAASEHEAPIEAMFEIAENGDFERIGEIACEAERDAMVAAFDVAGQLEIDDETLGQSLTYEITDRTYETLSEEAGMALVRVTGTMRSSVPEDQIDDVVRAMLESERSPDDPPVTDDEVDSMVGFMGSALNQTQALDQEVTVIREDGTWLLCGGLVDEPEPDPGFEPSVSTEGLCALATPADLSAVGDLAYDSSSGFEAFCNYSTTDFDDYHFVSVNLDLGADAENTAGYFEADVPVQIGDVAGYATAADSFQDTLFLQAGPDVLQVTVTAPESPPEGYDWLADATAVAEVFLPQLDAFRLELMGPPADPTPLPTPEISLCEALSLDQLNALTSTGMDSAEGSSQYCSYIQLDGEPGWHSVQLSLVELSLEDFRGFLPEAEDAVVGGLAALDHPTQLIVELPDTTWTLTVSGWLDETDEDMELTNQAMLLLVAEAALPGIRAPEPTGFLLEPVVEVFPEEGPGTVDAFELPTLVRPICDYVDLGAVNALGMMQYEEVISFYPELCALAGADPEVLYHDLTIQQGFFGIDEARTLYPDAQDLEIGGRGAFMGDDTLWVDTSQGPIIFEAHLPDGGAEVEDLTMAVAELVVPLIEADAD